jgi:MFS family permease
LHCKAWLNAFIFGANKQSEKAMTHSVSATAVSPPLPLVRFAPAVLIIFCGYLTIGMPLVVLPLQIRDQLGLGSLTVGIAIGIQPLVTLVTRQLAGSLCDRKGPKLAMLAGGCCALAASLIYLFSAAVPIGASAAIAAIVAARVVHGLGESLLITGSLAWAIAMVGASNTGNVMVWAGIGMYGAVAVGAPLGLWLMTATWLGGGFAAVGLVATICSLLATLIGVLVAPIAPHGGKRLPFIQVAFRIAPFGAGLMLATLGFGGIAAFAALDFQSKGWPGAGFVLAGFGAAYIATRVLFGHWPDRFGGARVALGSLTIEACGQVLLWLAPIPAVAFTGAIMTGVGFSLVFPSFGIEAVKQVSAADRGSSLGAYVAFFDLGFALAGPVTGLIASALGYPPVFAFGAMSAIVAVLPALCSARKRSVASPE